MSLIISAFAPVEDARRSLTPQLRLDAGPSSLILIDLGQGRNRLGGSALAQVYKQMGEAGPDLDTPELLKGLFAAMAELREAGLVLAWHDRSDGGLIVTLLEMAFAGRCGLDVRLDGAHFETSGDALAALFAEEVGGLLQCRASDQARVLEILANHGLAGCCHAIGQPLEGDAIRVSLNGELVLEASRSELHRLWASTSFEMRRLRDNPESAAEEYASISAPDNEGIRPVLSFDVNESLVAPFINRGARPRVAIVREQGVNGQQEMAAAFLDAGFDCIDLHMTDIHSGRQSLDDFHGLVACGGFSYGDVLGAGGGWAKSILHNSRSRDQFQGFFARTDRFALGVCNGCQMMAHLRDIIPGAAFWPHFVRNRSEQFEARFSQVEVLDSPSIFLTNMAGSRIPVAVAHGEGRADFDGPLEVARPHISLRFVGQSYPANPNGSPEGITGLCNADGRITIMMPHPERVFRTIQHSWRSPQQDDGWGEYSPWRRFFHNARRWVG